MANLGGIVQYQTQFQTGQHLANAGSTSNGMTNVSGGTPADASGAVRQELMQLGKGTVFTGTVTQMRDGNVTVSLDNGQTLHARLDSGVSVNLGQPVLFEVKSNQNNQLMLRQVPVDSAYNPTLQKALAAAGLAASGRNLAMVDAMMKNQLPINKGSLLAMARQLSAYPQASAESLAQMKKLGFPITETMVQQFEAYKQGNHSLVERFSQMMEQLPGLLSEAEGGAEGLLALNKGLLSALEILEGALAMTGGAAEGETAEGMRPAGALEQGTTATVENPQSADVSGSPNALEHTVTLAGEAGKAAVEGILSKELEGMAEAVKENAGPEGASEAVKGQNAVAEAGKGQNTGPEGASEAVKGQNTGPEGAVEAVKGQNPQSEAVKGQDAGPESLGSRGLPVSEFLGSGQTEELSHQLRQLGMGGDPVLFPEGKLDTSLDARELLRAIAQQLEQQKQAAGGAMGERIKSLFSGKGYQGLIKQALSQQWLLEPRQVEQEQAVEKLYERLNRQMNKLSQFMQETGRQDGAVARSTTQVRGNLEMMQQINHLYNYVQIPLKLKGQNAHSDLYVYTNKKNLQDRDGELSALLHLELDHLGVTDVRIRMLGDHVTTNFCMADETALALVEEHLEELTEALGRKGYQCSFQTEQRQAELDFVQDFLEHEAPIGKLARYSFDVLT